MRTLILNANNLIDTNNKNVFRYKFPNSAKFNKGDSLALMNLEIPYSWYNITSELKNNTLQITYNNQTTNIIIPDGYYTITALNSYIRSVCLLSTNNLPYSMTATNDIIYFFEFVQNTAFYSIQINSYPAVLGANSNPKGATFTGLTPVIRITSELSKIIGINSNVNYPSSAQNTSFSIYSAQQNNIPNFSGDQNSIVIECNIIENSLGTSSKILYSFSPVSTTFGRNIVVAPSQFSFIDILESNYQYLDIIFKDSVLNNLKMRDPNICIQLVIKSINE